MNGEPITERELKRMVSDPSVERQALRERGMPVKARNAPPAGAKELERVALKKLIYRRLLVQEAGRRGMTVTEQEIDTALGAVKRRFKDDESYAAWRKEQDLDDASLLEMLRTEVLVARASGALVQDARPAAEQIETFYEKHKANLKTTEAVRLQVIALKDKASAEGVMKKVKKGADFAAMAEERSKSSPAGEGAFAGWISPKALPPTLRTAVGTLKVGEIKGPLPTGSEFLIVKLVEQRPAAVKTLAEAQPEIEQHLLRAKQREVILAWLTAQEKQSKIEIYP